MASNKVNSRYCRSQADSSCRATLRSYSLRVISGTTPLVAFVPPSQPIRIIGNSAASQPVRKQKSGRIGRTAAIMRIMFGRSPDESLIAATRGHSSTNRRTVGTSMGEGEHGDVVQRDIDRGVSAISLK